MEIFTLDFVNAGITSPYEGVLGLDFIKQFCITLDFTHGQLKIEYFYFISIVGIIKNENGSFNFCRC